MIGILSLHGNVSQHQAVLDQLGQEHIEVKTIDDLTNVDRLIIPGGESTVMLKLLHELRLDAAITNRAQAGALPILGTCAGVIVLQELGLLDIDVECNAYGSQLHSFEAGVLIDGQPIIVAFIRAPIIQSIGPDVKMLAQHNGHPVLVRQGSHTAATFHAEARGETAVHKLWLRL